MSKLDVSAENHIDVRFQQALQYHRVGRLTEAEIAYRDILKNHPDHPGALHMQVLVTYQIGKLAEAGKLIDRALAVETIDATYQSNLAIVLQALNRTDEAIQCYRRAINLNPEFFEAYFNLGTLLQSMDKSADAIQCYRNTLKLNENFAAAQNNLGMLLAATGNIEEGISCLQKAVQIDPNFAVAFNNLAYACFLQGDLRKAECHCREALRIKPEFPEALNNLGVFLFAMEDVEVAEHLLEMAMRARNDFSEAHASLGKIRLSCGQIREALECFRKAAHLQPENRLYWQYISDTMNLKEYALYDNRLIEDIKQCLTTEKIDVKGASKAAVRLLVQWEPIGPWLSRAGMDDYGAIYEGIRGEELFDIINHPLLLHVLKSSIVSSIGLELLLTLVRKSFLQLSIEVPQHFQKSPETVSFLYALAHQCFLNEYVWFVSSEESAWINELEKAAEKLSFCSNPGKRPILVLLASYQPLYRFTWAGQLAGAAQSVADEQFKVLIRQQIEEPLEELRIREAIPVLTPIENPHSIAVQAQYEENPYPRWQGVKHLPAVPFISFLKTICPGIQHDSLKLPPHLSVLIAGCGSGQHAVQSAFMHKNADILALDISRASLAYGTRMARSFNIPHIRFMQGDILSLVDRKHQFHIIECVGVLHHLHDPHEGLRILTEVLQPDGIMLIGLYSEIARADLTSARNWVRKRNYATTPAGIRRCRRDIMQIPKDEPLTRCMAIKDFYNTSECRDLLFHVHEQMFTLPRIKKMLDLLGLKFIGFQTENPLLIQDYRNTFPNDPVATSLDSWHLYELTHPHAFIGMYQFYVKKVQAVPDAP
ncbi:MAG: tetratricopeptide repeat protein [Deltaproteobacteria bacterium]|nr:tetratricopeptide repeat protein [Deltaproteobacteria bacterium]